MNWTQLIDAVADRTEVPAKTVTAVLRATVAEVTERLVEGQAVRLQGLGILSTRHRAPRTLRSIESGRRFWLGGRTIAHFRPSAALKRALDRDQDWRREDVQSAWRLAETLIGDLAMYYPDAVPRIAADADADAVLEACTTSLGAAWTRAVETYHQRVPSDVALRTNHLLLAARRRWTE